MGSARSVSFFAVISLALHLAWVAWMPEAPRAIPVASHWVEMSFEMPAEAPAPPAPAALQVEPQQVAAMPMQPNAERAQKRKLAQPSKVELQPLQPQPPAEPALQPAPTQPLAEAEPAATNSSGAVKPLALSPRSAALSFEALGQATALRCAERTQGQNDCAPTQAETGRAAQAALTRDLNAVASSVPHLRAREHPVLRRRSDGSYAYEGGVFQAVVRPDGKVEFRDTSIRAELRPSLIPFVVIADLNDVVERDVLDRELYSAEKQWLMDETRELREQLASESRRRELLDANRALERTLRGILDDNALSAAQKHESLFLLWQDCGEDAQAQAHRRAVDSFVRRYMPQGSALGFRDQELEHFNTARAGLQKFEPYAGS
jgi:hypothetical protein